MSEVHIFSYDDGNLFEVWLDTDIAEQDGLCIGVGPTRYEAIVSAAEDLEEALRKLVVMES